MAALSYLMSIICMNLNIISHLSAILLLTNEEWEKPLNKSIVKSKIMDLLRNGPLNKTRGQRTRSSYSSKRPVIVTNHPLVTLYNDSNPPPTQIDQFTPYLSKKISTKREISKRMSQILKTQIPMQSEERKDTPKNDHSYMEQLFDNIASAACDTPLNALVETHLKHHMNVDNVFFFHDVSSVSVLYCPTNSVIVPHGSGLIGYCHFSRKTLNIECAQDHMSFSKMYDGKVCQANSRLLIFPLFDHQGHIKAVVQALRAASGNAFTQEDEALVEYLQRKFQLYSRWLFQPIISESTFANLVRAQRLGEFVEIMTVKLMRLFNCKAAEIWELNKEDNEVHQYIPGSSTPMPVALAESGVVGYALTGMTALSLVSVNRHAAYNQRVDGNGDQSILVIPVKDPEHAKVYGLALRGKRLPNFFTDLDEKILARIAPVVVASLNSSEVVERSYQSLEDSVRSQKRLQSLLEVAETLSGQLHIDELIPSIMTRACELVKADRCSLFMVSENREKLVTTFNGGLANAIEIPISAGIVGFTATTGQILNIKDAYEDPRFNRATDLSTGYRTHNLLCVPIFDDKNEIRGVTEMINKLDGVFTTEDEKLIQVFNVFCGISIENARLYRASIDLSLQLRTVLQISQSIAQSSAIKKLIEEILRNSRKVIGAGRAMIYLVNTETNDFETFATDEDIDSKTMRVKRANENPANGKLGARRALIHKMMAGGNLKTTEELQREDSERAKLVQQTIDTGESQISNNEEEPDEGMIVCPVVSGSTRTILGALLMQWKKKEHVFTQEDLKLLESFAVFISISLERSRMKQAVQLGTMELALRQTIRDELERKGTYTPDRLLISEEEKTLATTLRCDCSTIDDFRLLFHLFDVLELRNKFEIHNEKLFCFLFDVKNHMQNVEYFNWEHAKARGQFLCYAIARIGIERFTPEERIAMLIAVIAHDVCRERCSQDFHETMEPMLSYLCNDDSTDKSSHYYCFVLMEMMSKSTNNIFEFVSKERREKIWRMIIDLVRSTEMSKHFDIVNNRRDPLWKQRMLIKMCDISDLARPGDIATVGKQFISQEFFDNGDLSRATGIEYNEDGTVDREKSQSGFILSVCVPVFRELSNTHSNLRQAYEQLKSNMRSWEMVVE